MDVDILLKTLETQPKNHLQTLIEKYLYLELGIEPEKEEAEDNDMMND